MVGQIGEDRLVSQLTSMLSSSKRVIVGAGLDDCAVVEVPSPEHFQLLKTDSVVESVHFLPGTDPVAVGRKALCRVISDIGATGGTPECALVTLAVDTARSVEEIEGWYQGIRLAAEEFGSIDIVGGETTSLPSRGALISIAMTASVRKTQFLARTGAVEGDKIFVTGRLGGSFGSERHLDFTPRLAAGQWLAQHQEEFQIHSMMDISDGLAKDLPRLANSSGNLGYTIDMSSLPINEDSNLEGALSEGEDYELLFSAADQKLLDNWPSNFPDLELTMIGEFSAEASRTELEGGWDHFGTDK